MTTNGPASNITITRRPFRGPLVRQLIAEMVEEMNATYGDPTTDVYAKTPLEVPQDDEADAAKTEPSDLAFFVAFASAPDTDNVESALGEAMGCVAVKLSLPDSLTALEFPGRTTAELKRLYARPAYRAFGLGQKLLDVAEAAAKAEMGVELLLLETGIRQPASIKLYERNGWKHRPLFGPYTKSGMENGGFSVCYEKALV